MNKKVRFLIILLVLMLIAALSVTIFLGVQKSQNDLRSLRSDLKSLERASGELQKNILLTQGASSLDEEYYNSYSTAMSGVKKYADTIEGILKTYNSSDVTDAYKKYSTELTQYIISNENLLKSIRLYLDVWKSCGDMGGKLDEIIAKQPTLKSADFVTNSEDCRLALLASSYAPDVSFNQQFFDAFRINMESVFATYKSGFTESTADRAGFKLRVEGAWNEVLAMNSALLDLQRSPDPTGAIQALQEVVDEQKAGLF